MLKSLSLKNFRCFSDTGKIDLSRINIFIGPNNAGKSSFLSATELLLRTGERGFADVTPLRFSEQSEYASFSSILRKGWSRKEQKATAFTFDAEWFLRDKSVPGVWSKFTFRGNEQDDLTYVKRADYGTFAKGGKRNKALVKVTAERPHRATATADYKLENFNGPASIYFLRGFPYVQMRNGDSAAARKYMNRQAPIQQFAFEEMHSISEVSVVRPNRPNPRRLYVLDDPSLSPEDRAVMSVLVKLWQVNDATSAATRRRIAEALRTLNLANHIDVTRPMRGATAAFQVRVSTGSKRELVTIADVGYGLSQALPLIAHDAGLSNGVLIAYQPEVHLHPFAQSRLADIFAMSAARGNTIFVETHSPELILRMQYLIASEALDSKDVKVFCVEKGKNQSEISEMSFTEDGSPRGHWPRGFLDTGLTLARELAQARNA